MAGLMANYLADENYVNAMIKKATGGNDSRAHQEYAKLMGWDFVEDTNNGTGVFNRKNADGSIEQITMNDDAIFDELARHYIMTDNDNFKKLNAAFNLASGGNDSIANIYGTEKSKRTFNTLTKKELATMEANFKSLSESNKELL
jgi:hypothetical protein